MDSIFNTQCDPMLKKSSIPKKSVECIEKSSYPQSSNGFWSTCLACVSTASPAKYSLFGPTDGGDMVRTPCQRYASSTASFPTTSLPPTPSSALTNATATATNTSEGSKSLELQVSPVSRASTCSPSRIMVLPMSSILDVMLH